MSNRIPITITELDFDRIKSSFIAFLKSQDSPIKDYNYEGSNFNIILDVLSANTHYEAFYYNMLANEMFGDSAILRSSMISHAKRSGYTPRSARASKSTLTISISPKIPGNNVIAVPANTAFMLNVNDETFTYYNLNVEYLNWSDSAGAYVGDVEVFCGNIFTQNITYTAGKQILIDADGIDTTTLVVQVQNSSIDLTTNFFTPIDSVIEVTDTSRVYFARETDLQRYEIQFGDGILGQALVTGNIVMLKYVAADYNAPAGFSDFVASSTLFPGMIIDISATPTTGFVAIESVDSIRSNMQKARQSQNREVISEDYEFHIMKEFPDLVDVRVWGGEDNDPPVYGRVFFSAVSPNLTKLPISRKQEIISAIKKRNMRNFRPVSVDPEYFSIGIVGYVRVKYADLNIDVSILKEQILSYLSDFSAENLGKFNASLSLSKIQSKIDSFSDAITSIVFSLTANTQIELSGETINKEIHFRNPIKPGSFQTDRFYIDDYYTQYFLKDVSGKINLYRYEEGFPDGIFIKEMGPIDYSSGKCQLIGLTANSYTLDRNITIRVQIDSSEMISMFNQIFYIDEKESSQIEIRTV